MPKKMPRFSSDESDLFPDDAQPSDANSTREEFINRCRSGYTKIRHEFVQTPATSTRPGSTPAMLPIFARNHRAAVLYLAVLTNWTWVVRSGEVLAADTWIRFLSSDKPHALTWTPQSLSHAWNVLEEAKLIERSLEKRLKKVVPRHESGSGSEYSSPNGTTTGVYFALPHEFWTEEWHATLSWPALAVLLILLKESSGRPYAELAVDRAEKYYGISRSTAETGLSELRDEGLLMSRTRWVQDPVAREGRRWTSLHALADPFSMAYRRNLGGAAQKRLDAAAMSTKNSSTKTVKKTTKKKPKKVVNDEHPEEAGV